MTGIAAAIREAAAAGWDVLEWVGSIDVTSEPEDPFDAHVWGVSADGAARHPMALASVIVDPSFWRALGRSRGWGENEWRSRGHRMIDDLADGRSFEACFERLGGP